MSSYLQNALEGRIDFEGQKTVEVIVKGALTMSTFTGFVMGFIFQDLRVTFGILGVATLVLALVVLPPWPMFNRHGVDWVGSKAKKE